MSARSARPASLEDLPVEIFGEIFVFLSFRDLVAAFCNLNRHIDSIVRSIGAVNHVIKYDETDVITVPQLVPTSITCLVVVHVRDVDFTPLVNLQSLVLKYGTHAQFNSIRPDHFPNLELLHVSASKLPKTATDTYKFSSAIFRAQA